MEDMEGIDRPLSIDRRGSELVKRGWVGREVDVRTRGMRLDKAAAKDGCTSTSSTIRKAGS